MSEQQRNLGAPVAPLVVWLVVLRVVLSLGVLIALPFSNMQWGASYPGGGPDALAFIGIFAGIGLLAALLFVAVGSLAQFLLRKRAPRYTVLIDVGLCIAFVGALAYAGVTARYTDTEAKPPNEAPDKH